MKTIRRISNWTEPRLDVLKYQLGLFLNSISHISPSGAKRRCLAGFMPTLERALATKSSHKDRNKGRSNKRKQRTRVRNLVKV